MDTNANIERVAGIVTSEIDGEFLVCAPDTQETSLLSGEAAEFFNSLPESGSVTLADLKTKLPDLDVEAITTILLEKNLIVVQNTGLLFSRRDMLVKSGRIAAATALVASIGMPTPAQAQSCGSPIGTFVTFTTTQTNYAVPAGARCFQVQGAVGGGGAGGGGGAANVFGQSGGRGGDGAPGHFVTSSTLNVLTGTAIDVIIGQGGLGGGGGINPSGGGAGGGGGLPGGGGGATGSPGRPGTGGGGGGGGGGATFIRNTGGPVVISARGGGGGGGGEGGAGNGGVGGSDAIGLAGGVGGSGGSPAGGDGGLGGSGETGTAGNPQTNNGGGGAGAIIGSGTTGANGDPGAAYIQFYG